MLRLQREPGDVAGATRGSAKHGMARCTSRPSRDGKSIAKALRSIEPGLRLSDSRRGATSSSCAAGGDGVERGPRAGAASSQGALWLGPFLDTVCRFTGVSDRHDDDVDALAYAWTAGSGSGVTQFSR